jgi:hypothetical protein
VCAACSVVSDARLDSGVTGLISYPIRFSRKLKCFSLNIQCYFFPLSVSWLAYRFAFDQCAGSNLSNLDSSWWFFFIYSFSIDYGHIGSVRISRLSQNCDFSESFL